METLLTNIVICGDCKDKMDLHIPSESVDLIYGDPPFFSGKNYEVVWKDGAEVASFGDTEFYTLECRCGRVFPDNYEFCPICGARKDDATERRSNDIEAYLQWLRPRLDECYRVLKQTGSMYLHLDWHAVHYVKVMMDDIFGYKNFRNEIIWSYRRWPAKQDNFQKMHDSILRYSKTKDVIWNQLFEPLAESTLKQWGDKKQAAVFDISGERVKSSTHDEKSPGAPMRDVWDISVIAPRSKERLGYPTQKPEALLDRIIKASSNPGDIVLDPFCGCGTALAVADKLRRMWIGIDVSPTACRKVVDRLHKIDGSIGMACIEDLPMTDDEMEDLPYFEFQNWVVRELGGRQVQKKGADGGIDGYTFAMDPIQVKQSPSIGAPAVKLFAHNIQNVDKTSGIFVALSFGSGAVKEAKHIKDKFGVSIELLTASDIRNGKRNYDLDMY